VTRELANPFVRSTIAEGLHVFIVMPTDVPRMKNAKAAEQEDWTMRVVCARPGSRRMSERRC